MKKMRKILLTVFSCVFAVALGLGIAVSGNKKVKAAVTETEIQIIYAVVQYTRDPATYTFVTPDADKGVWTEKNYPTYVYFNGQRLSAKANDGYFYIDLSSYDCAVGETFLLEIPAGTYYQSNAVVAKDVVVKCTLQNDDSDGSKNGSISYVQKAQSISETPYSIELNKLEWALSANTSASGMLVTILDPNKTIKSGVVDADDWTNGAQYTSLNAVKVNGEFINAVVKKVYADNGTGWENAYVEFSNNKTVNDGDVVTFDGWFTNATYGSFKIEKTEFVYEGGRWTEEMDTYHFDHSTITDSNPQNGFYLSMVPNHIPVSSTNDGWKFTTKPISTNLTGLYNGVQKNIHFYKYSATNWYVSLSGNEITAVAGDVVTFGGVFSCLETTEEDDPIKTHFIKLDNQSFSFDGSKWTEITPTIEISAPGSTYENYLVVAPGQDSSEVTATASNGNQVTINFGDAVEGGKFVLREGESISDYNARFSVADEDGTVYTKRMIVRVCFEDFVMEEGAAVRVANDAVNGLRFSAEMSATTYENLSEQGATFGIVIVPRDYITKGYGLTSSNLFGANAKYSATATVGVSQSVRRMLLIDNLTPRDVDGDGKYEIRGAITEILSSNLTREFVGVAYVCVNGEYIVASYYANDIENNARSIYYVSQRAIEEGDKNASKVQTKYIDGYATYLANSGKTYDVSYTVRYIKTRKGTVAVEEETFTAPLNQMVTVTAKDYSSDNYALTTGISSVTTVLYANKENVIEFRYKDISLPDLDKTAWHHPKLDDTNNYDNATNEAIATTMAEAGFTSVMLNGHETVGDIYLNSAVNIEVMKNIIDMFWKYGGIKTYVSGKNASDSDEFVKLEDYKGLESQMATLSECEGFGGFFAWDEPIPTTQAMNRLAEYAEFFDGLYGNEALFMVNLFPSYYDGWSSGDYTSYSAYIKAYCDIVLPKIENGTKYLSMDSYPVNASGELDQTFMYDLAVLKHYALTYGAQANAILQGCGWTSNDKYEVPTEAEYRMMLYTALAFGMDSVGWWGYAPETTADDTTILGDQAPVDINGNKNSAYDAIKNVNTEIANFGSLYKTYTWQGVIMSSPSKGGWFGSGKDAQYEAFNKVKSEGLLSSYMLSATDTNSFASISSSGSNHVVGVMKDGNGNEAFTVVNYSAPTDNKTLTITFTPKVDGEYVIYTADGSQTVTMTTSGYKLTLAPGAGAFIASNDTKYTVRFKNYDCSEDLYVTQVANGNTPVYVGETPVHPNGYEFIGWTPTLGPISSDMVYEPIFDEKFTITFKDYNGLVLYDVKLQKGEMPVYSGETPTRDGCEFIGWDPEITTVMGDATYTAQYKENPTVTYVNYDGTMAEKAEKLAKGTIIDYEPTLDGYIFKGWTLQDGSEFVNDGIDGDVTLVANWYKLVSETDSVLSAADVKEGVTLEPTHGYKEEDATANPNASWYFDSDYHGATGAGGTVENQFANWVRFTLTYDGGAGTSETGRETYLILPAINYKLYSKVDFVYTNNANIKKVTIYDVDVTNKFTYGSDGKPQNNNKLISIRAENDAIYLYYQEINSYGTAGWNQAKIQLPESVANGSEGLRLNFTVGGWFQMAVTEFHLTQRAVDYMPEIKGALADIESDPNNTDAFNKYLELEQYMTEYEKANIELSENFLNLLDNKLLNAVLNAEAGSAEQASAIEDYRDFHNGLTADEQTETHKFNLATVNSVVNKNFYELGAEIVLENKPTLSEGLSSGGDRIANGDTYNSNYNTQYTQHVYMTIFNNTTYDGTITLPTINYDDYAEVYFGMYAISDKNSTITVGGKTISFFCKGNNYKIVISCGVLSIYNDQVGGDGALILKALLSDDVRKGVSPLVFEYTFECYSIVEVTEMHVTPFEYKNTAINAVKSIETSVGKESNVAINGNSKFNDSTKYPYTTFSYTQGEMTSATFTLNAFNFSDYEEVYFGIGHAMVYSGGGSMTIAGQTFNITKLGGYTYRMKATVKNGVLTVTDDGSQEPDMAVEPYFIQVALSESVLNGSEGLVITFNQNGSAFAWLEVTNMIASSKVRCNIISAVHDNQVVMTPNGTTISNNAYADPSHWGEYNGTPNCKTDFNTTYGKYNMAQFGAQSSTYTVNCTLPVFNFSNYSETYFGFTAVTAEGTCTVTVNGESYSYDLNKGYVYVKMLIKGNVLTVVGDGANNAGTEYMTVELPASVINGTESLVITWQTAGWSQVEITEMHTTNWVDAIA